MAEANGAVPTPREAQQAQSPPPSQPLTTSMNAAPPQTSAGGPAGAPSGGIGGSSSSGANAGEDGLGKRPRDARLIHAILANQGVTAYQERVPLQLLDFCYRYSSSTLADALHLTSEMAQAASGSGKIAHQHYDANAVSMNALRLSVASRTHYQLNPSLPKEYLIELAAEKNKTSMPPVGRDWGTRLPPERYCLTGVGYGVRDEWESEGEEEVVVKDEFMKEVGDEDEDNDEEEEGGRMDDLYGGGADEDEDMDTKDG